MPHLREIQPAPSIGKPPPEVRAAIRAWRAGTATESQQLRAYAYVVNELCGITQLHYAMPGEESVVNWRQGCRYVGLSIEIAAMLPPEDDNTPPEPPARTMTERARRRAAKP